MQQRRSQTFPAKLDRITEMLQFIANWCSDAGSTESACNSLKLIVDEIASNVCNYGTDKEHAGPITISVSKNDKTIVLEIADQGIPFNPLEQVVPNTTAPLEERPIGGLGIFLVQQVSESVSYRREGNENRLTMILKDAV